MFPDSIIAELERNASVFQALFNSLSSEEYLWKTSPEKWCLLEIVCHLVDEEIEDFRTRVRHAMKTPEEPLKSISPKTWPVERAYLQQDFETVLQRFLSERQTSVTWLKSLKDVNWKSALQHSDLGPMSARDFLENWLAHDYLHIRQINAIRREYFNENSDSDLTYAGNW